MRKEGDITPVGKIISEKLVYPDPLFPVVERVIEDQNGKIRDPQYLWDRGGRRFAIAFAFTDKSEIVFVKEPKYGQMDLFISLPTGGVKRDEREVDAVAREFLAETGYQCSSWRGPFNDLSLVDFADKTDGGEHLIFTGYGAIKVKEPEPLREVVLIKAESVRQLILKGDIKLPAISIATLFLAIPNNYFRF